MISVVIPTHNRPQDLKRALHSVFSQTFVASEVIVVDDGSFEPVSKGIFDGYQSSIKCILVRNEKPQGGNYSRNIGASLASGKYIAFLDDDDTWIPNKLEKQIQIMEAGNLEISYTAKTMIKVDGNLKKLSQRYSYKEPNYQNLNKSIMKKNFIGTTSSILVNREFFNDVGGFDIDMPALQDYELYLRLIYSGGKVKGIDEPLVNYYVYSGRNAVSKSLRKNINATRHILAKHKRKSYYYFLVFNLFKITLKKIIRGQ
ncbi:glycosyltransferase family 2 protein [Vibrio cincinnatiensis]